MEEVTFSCPGHEAVLTVIYTLGFCSLGYSYFISLRNRAGQLSFSWELPGSWSVSALGSQAEELDRGTDGYIGQFTSETTQLLSLSFLFRHQTKPSWVA